MGVSLTFTDEQFTLAPLFMDSSTAISMAVLPTSAGMTNFRKA
jgi:hypothetical protein